MDDSRKKPGWAFWTVLTLTVLPGLYVASFGPACWIASRTKHPRVVFEQTYFPLGWCAEKIGDPAWSVLVPYASAGMPPATNVVIWTGSPMPSKIGTGWDTREK